MKARSRATLGRALEDLGSTLLEVVHGEPDLAEEIGAVVIHDRLDSSALPLRSLVLGVGVGGSEEISRLLIELGKQHALGLILRAPVAADEAVIAATVQSGVPLIGLGHGASWAQVAALLRSELADGDMWSAATETLGGTPSGDLFTLANAIAALLDAPITIEDRSSRILAFAGRQEEADPARVEAILGRQVPEKITLRYVEHGVFRQLYSSDRPIFVEVLDADIDTAALPRMAVAVRAGDEVLGSIWVVVSEPKSAEWSRSLADAAKLVALHMMRSRAGDEIERRRRTELVSTALDGGANAREALNRLGLADRPMVVLALALADAADAAQSVSNDADLAAERERMRDAFAMHLSAVHPRSAVATIGGVVYGLLAVAHETAGSDQHAVRVARDFVDRVGGRARVVIAVSSVVSDAPELGRARSNAMRALHVLRTGGAGTRRVARLEDVHVERSEEHTSELQSL